MKRFWDRTDDFMRFCLEWGAGAAKDVAGRRSAAPLLIALIAIFGGLVLWLMVWLSDALGWNQ